MWAVQNDAKQQKAAHLVKWEVSKAIYHIKYLIGYCSTYAQYCLVVFEHTMVRIRWMIAQRPNQWLKSSQDFKIEQNGWTACNLTVTVSSSTSGSEEEKDKTIINLQIGFPERDRLDSLVCIGSFIGPMDQVNLSLKWRHNDVILSFKDLLYRWKILIFKFPSQRSVRKMRRKMNIRWIYKSTS